MTALTDPLAEGAVQAVLAAGRLLADPAAVRSIRAKSETDYVTNVDLAVQEFLREHLAALAPDVQFMAEEQDNSALDLTRPCWILDPVDGTTNLIHQFQHSAISLALAEGGQIVFGVVYNPYTEECFAACRGGGAFRNGVPSRSAPSPGWRTASCPRAPFPAAGSWRTRRFARCGRCMTGARTCAAPAAPAWSCVMWPADGWRAMWSFSPAVGLRRWNAHRGGGRGTGYRSWRRPPLSGGGRASAGLQWAAPRRAANNFERMRVSSWTCAFPPPLGN